jgi:hypothetical protein
MVLVMESDGSLTPSRSQNSFARNYNDGIGQGSVRARRPTIWQSLVNRTLSQKTSNWPPSRGLLPVAAVILIAGVPPTLTVIDDDRGFLALANLTEDVILL